MFTTLAMGIVFLFFANTQERIDQSRADFERSTLYEISAALGDTEQLSYSPLAQLSSYRIMRGEESLGVIVPAVTEDGYSGAIRMLVAIKNDGSIIAVKVTEHKETPGLGDRIEAAKSPWSKQFVGRRLNRTNWETKKEGGDFDALSGATISSHAVITAVRNSLDQWEQTQWQTQ